MSFDWLSRLAPLILVAVSHAPLVGCGAEGGGGASTCTTSTDCPVGRICVEGRCRSSASPMDAAVDAADATSDAPGGCGPCGPGERCDSTEGRCRPDCLHPEAVACASGQVCDAVSGRCVAEGSPGILTGEETRCGDAGPRCRTGTMCDVSGTRCVPQPPCNSMRCTEDDSVCWGTLCQARRPDPWCTPAPLERMNQPDFLLQGTYPYEGIDDLEFDDTCHAYASTMTSGPDYLRQLAPDGTLSTWRGITDINMGQVAVLRPLGGEFGAGDEPGEVAATYIGPRYGVVRLVRDDADSPLPLVLSATMSQGDGPFGLWYVDMAPTGLLWGPDRNLYVGEIAGHGDLARVDLASGTHTTLATFEERIFTTENFDATSILVATEGGRIFRVDIRTGERAPWATLATDEDVASLVRDPFSGVVYATVRQEEGERWRIEHFSARGEALGALEGIDLHGPARIAYAPDGKLYVLYIGGVGDPHIGPGPPRIEAVTLPAGL